MEVLPAVADCVTVTLVDRFDGAFSPVEQSADSRAGRLANGSCLRGQVLVHLDLLGFVTGHNYLLYQGARRRSRRAQFTCRVRVVARTNHTCGRQKRSDKNWKLIVNFNAVAHKELDATRARSLRQCEFGFR